MTYANNNDAYDDVEDLIDLRSVWVGLRRRAALFVGATSAVFAAVAAYAFLSMELYTAETALMIEPKTQVFAYGSEVLGQSAADPTMVDTEVELLRSRAMAIRVNNRLRSSEMIVADLEKDNKEKLQDDFFTRRLSAIAADLAALQSNQNIMDASVTPTNDDAGGTSDADTDADKVVQNDEAEGETETVVPAQITQLESEVLMEAANSKVEAINAQAFGDEKITPASSLLFPNRAENSRAITKLMKNLEIQRVGSTFLIKVRHNDPSPDKAAEISNAYAEEYILQQLEAQYNELRQANRWIDARLATLRDEVRAADAAAAQYRAEQGLVDVTGESFSEKALTGIATELAAARTNLASARARYNTVSGLVRTGAPFDSISEVMTSPVIAGLRAEYSELSRRRAELNVRYGDRHPEIKKVNEEITSIDAQLEREQSRIVDSLRSEVRFAEAQVRSLERNLQEAQGDMATNNEALVKLLELERDIEATRGVYEALLNRQKELNERDQLANANARIIARAEPPEAPSKPRKNLIIAGGFMLALMIGGVSAFAAESMDKRVRNTHDVRREFGPNAPVVLVPRIQSRLLFRERRCDDVVRRYIQEEPESSFAESLRDLRMYLKSAQRELNHAPSIAFTSVFKGEGTTTISFAFASQLASTGARVAYFECPSRAARYFKPSDQHDEIGYEDTPRLSDNSAVEAEEDAADGGAQEWSAENPVRRPGDVIKTTNMTIAPVDHKFVMDRTLCGVQMMSVESDSGIIDELDISIFDSMIDNIRESYDYIVIDTPSVLARNEGSLIAAAADYTFLVMEWCTTTRGAARAATQRLLDTNARILSFVVNKVDEKQRYYFRPEDRQFYFRKSR